MKKKSTIILDNAELSDYQDGLNKLDKIYVPKIIQQPFSDRSVNELMKIDGAERKDAGFKSSVKSFFEYHPFTPKKWAASLGRKCKGVYEWLRYGDKSKLKSVMLGVGEKKGVLPMTVSYILLILFGFVYIFPMLYMLAYSLMSPSDVINPLISYVPTRLFFGNYKEAYLVLNYFPTLFQTLYVAVLPAILQAASTSLIAYGLARFNFKGKSVLFGLVLITFIIPSQITMMPQVLMYSSLGIGDSILAYLIPALFGQGLKSAVFVLVFYQFFRAMPKAMEEAAKIDGSNAFMIFIRLGLPMALPAYLLSFLLSLVWYYNETLLATVFFGGSLTTLPIELEKFKAAYEEIFGSASTTGKNVNEAIVMAATMLTVLPLLVIFFCTQRFFVDGIDKAGITGE